MKLEYILMAVTFAVLFLAALVSQHIKEKKGATGADQARLRRVAARQLDSSAFYTMVYAYDSQVTLGVARSSTTYSSYIVAFRPGELFVIPLQFSGPEIISHPGFRLDRENVGAVRSDKASRTTFFGTDGAELCTVRVLASNTAEGPFQPLNIQQKAETERFYAFLRQFSAEVQSMASQQSFRSGGGSPMTPPPNVYIQRETERHRNI